MADAFLTFAVGGLAGWLVVLTMVHVFMVFAVDPYSLRSMITGGYDESESPERRNARPLWWKKPDHRPPATDHPARIA